MTSVVYTITYDRREGGWRAATSVARENVEVTARTLASARRTIVDRVALLAARGRRTEVVVAPDGTRRLLSVPAVDDVRLPAREAAALAEARTARREALESAARSHTATARAAEALVAAGLSYRDVAYLLGLSHGRVQQLVAAPGGTEPNRNDQGGP